MKKNWKYNQLDEQIRDGFKSGKKTKTNSEKKFDKYHRKNSVNQFLIDEDEY